MNAIEVLHVKLGTKDPVHPNYHVNLGQSSNDTFPTLMHVAFMDVIHKGLLPSLASFHETLESKADEWSSIVKIGRTHTQNATPLTLGQEFSGYASQISSFIMRIRQTTSELLMIAQGGTNPNHKSKRSDSTPPHFWTVSFFWFSEKMNENFRYKKARILSDFI